MTSDAQLYKITLNKQHTTWGKNYKFVRVQL